LTDSKRSTQLILLLALGSRKSLRYQPIDPAIDSLEVSVAFHAFGTVVFAHPSVLVVRMKRDVSPWSALSRRKSQSPPMRYRLSGPA
jgi:hypothetical protein